MSATVTYSKLFEHGYIRNLEIKNRVVFAPISTNLASITGEVSERLVQHYHKVAKGGAGLIIVENACIQFPEGRHGATQPRIDSDKFVPGLYHLAQAIKQTGAKACIELAHPGGIADPHVTRRQPVAPSSVPTKTGVTPRELAKDEIEKIAYAFGMATLRAKKALFDMIEVQAGHGLLINQFLSPLTNKRKDEFGGSIDNRIRFAKMVIEKIREYAGDDFPLSIRLGVEEFTEGGITINEGKTIAKELVSASADAIHVTLGNTDKEKRLEPIPYPQGWRTYLAEQVKKEVNIPVITVGVIREPWFAEKILEEGKADFIALGRALIADPEWPRKTLKGDEKFIRRCISCNECVIARHYEELPIRCSVNPSIGLDEKLTAIKKAKIRKKVMIIGAGPAGMEAARVSALRCHDVYLYEKNSKLGGTLNIASIVPGKEKLKWIIEYYAYELPRLGVYTHFGCTVNRKKIEELKPDIVIIATGAKPTVPNIIGANNSNVVFVHDVLGGKVKVKNSKVIIIGGGLIGLETAEFLASESNKVTVVKQYETISRDIEPLYASYLLSELKKLRVKIMFKVKVKEIKFDCVIVKNDAGRSISIPSDWVVIARGLKPSNRIVHELKGHKVYLIGDCLKPRRIYNAIFEGFMTARQI
jgi:2,4-dienoyl-CoA reductase-like NADH-dependent reductase (Old Yellow Enzyme family)/thioredoxin reductase